LRLAFAFPPQVLLIQDDVFEGNLERNSVPQHEKGDFSINLLDHSDASPEQCQAVALL
jgi:hypothetical protein